MSSKVPIVVPSITGSDDSDAASLDLWKQALITLSAEDRKQFDNNPLGMLDTLNNIREATESKQKECVRKGWRLYSNKDGEEVKLRHVLEKISVWVKEIIKIIDVGVSLDQSGYAALPWAIVKFVTNIGFSDIELFSNVTEGIESVSGLLTRYTIVEKLYLHQDCETKAGLHQAITKLYAAILTYLAKIKAYCTGNTWKRFGRSLIEAIRKQYDELWAKVSETEVEKWTKLVDVEVQRAMSEDATTHDRALMDTLIGLNRPIVQMSEQISMIQDKLKREERIQVFLWMSAIEYRSHHDDLSKGLLAQSGQWLLESQHFIEWGQSSVSSILWLHGIPGSGKTRLVSTVINTVLNATPNSPTSPTAFFYCARSTAEPERAKPAEIMGALLRQLASSNPDLPVKEPVAKEYEARSKKAADDCSALKKLTVEDCTRLIIELTQNHPATIILDALDECEENTRHELLEAFDEIISNSGEIVKVFVSSRDDIDIKLQLESSKNISIGLENNSSDIAGFVRSEVDRLIKKRLLLDGRVSPRLKGNMIETLINGAQGMFRWVELSLEALKRIKFVLDFKKALGQLPSELSGLYDIIHAQIDKTEPCGRDVAIQTLKWLLCAQRLLSAEELIAAVYKVDDEMSSDSDENFGREDEQLQSPKDDILRLCRNLVVFDSEQALFRFAHQSVREYLLKRPQYTVLEQHTLAAERCLDVYLTESLQGSMARNMERQNGILKPYAEVYWPVHYSHVEDSQSSELEKKVSRFTGQVQGTPLPYLQWISDIRLRYGGRNGWNVNEILGLDRDDRLGHRIAIAASPPDSILAAACAFGLLFLLKRRELLPGSWNQCQELNGYRYSLLCIAALEGHAKVVQLLLDKGVDVNAPSTDFVNALVEASRMGYDHIEQMLLDQGADINVQDSRFGGSALHAASYGGYIQIVQILLDRGADIDAQSWVYGSALQAASGNGHDHIVQVLLDHGADINASHEDYGTALQAASRNGHDQVVRVLLDYGADINASHEDYGTALQLASRYGYNHVVRVLLDHGADININAAHKYQGTALQMASRKGHGHIVQMLLDHGAEKGESDGPESPEETSGSEEGESDGSESPEETSGSQKGESDG